MRTVGIVLAAGLSSRMGAFKPLLPIDDPGGDGCVTVLERTVKSLLPAADRVYVVTGCRAAELRPLIARLGAVEVHNPDFMGGMSTSVLAGVRTAAGAGAEGLLLLPCDAPAVPPECVLSLMDAAGPDSFAVPCFLGKKGHPLWVPRRFFGDILDAGSIKLVTRRVEEAIVRVETGREGVVLDLDTPAAYQEILDYLSRGETDLKALFAGRRLIMVRHGETVRHPGPIFMGQYDPPLSKAGFLATVTAAAEAARQAGSASRIYSSDLKRAMAMAEAVSNVTGLPVEPVPGLREISLGKWDGRLIADVRRDFPEDYRRRGESLMLFKPQGGENFYDLRYRARRALIDILRRDPGRDILMTTHAGVMRALVSAVTGRDPQSIPKPGLCSFVRVESRSGKENRP